MRVDMLTEEKLSSKIYKNYNNNNSCSSTVQQEQQHIQLSQQKNRAFSKAKFSNGNNVKNIKYHNNSNNNNNNNNNNSAHLLDGNYTANISRNTKKSNYENNSKNNSASCSSTTSSNSRNSSPSLSITDENVSTVNVFQQQQQQQQSNFSTVFVKQNSLSSSTDAGASKMIDSPVTSTIYSATWRSRNTNTSTTTIGTISPYYNDDNNNSDHKICCPAAPQTATIQIGTAGVASLLSPKSHHSAAILTLDAYPQQKEQQQLRKSSFLLSNAKVSSIEYQSPNSQQTNSSSLSATLPPTSLVTSETGKQHQHHKQQEQQQSSFNDCSNSYQSLPRTQSTTARTKSSPKTTTTSSSSSVPFPLANNGATCTNNTGNQENGSKGGGGGKSHSSNRKRYWKLNSANSGGTVVIGAGTNSAGPASSNSATASDIPNVNGIPNIAIVNIENNINSASSKPNSRTKNSNNKNHRYNPQTQAQYPETWKKNSAMTTVTSAVTNATNLNGNGTVSTSANIETLPAVLEDNTMTGAVSKTQTTTTTCNTMVSTSSIGTTKTRTKAEEKNTSDASTTTEKIHSEEKASALSSIQQNPLPVSQSPLKNRSYSDSVGSVNRNCPTGTPSYTLDFLHSVGKRMLAFGGAFPTTPVNRGNPAVNSNNNAIQQSQQTGHRSNRYITHNNGGFGHGNQHHHHHPQPQQLTIASFLQKDMFGSASSSVRGVGNGNTANSSNTSANSAMNTENSQHTYNNQMQYQQHRFHNFYNHPPSTPHYYRHQGVYQTYNNQNGMVPTSANNAQRYHNSNNSNNSATTEQSHRQQPPRNQQQRQHPVQQQQYGGSSHSNGNNNFGSSTPTRKHKTNQQAKSPSLQNASSPSSSTSSLSSLTSITSSNVGGNSRPSNASNKSNSRPNSSLELLPPKTNIYPGGSNGGTFRHNNHNRQHNTHFNHHAGSNGPPSGAIMGQHQNFNNLTYVITNGNGSEMGSIVGNNLHTPNGISSSESSSRACSPSIINSSENPNPETSQSIMLGIPSRFIHPDQQAYIINTQNLRPGTVCQPMINMNQNDSDKHDQIKPNSGCNEYDDLECSSSQQSEDGLHCCNGYHQILPPSQSTNTQIPNPMDFAFNPIMQHLPPGSLHFQSQSYRNGMMGPCSGFHEDDFHLHGAIQQQMPSMFFTSNDQMSAMNGQNNNNFPNAGNVAYSQSAMTLIPSCPSTASNMSRSSEEDPQMMSSRSSSSGSDQLKGSTPEISTDISNEMHDQMGGMSRNNSCSNTLPSARSRSARNQPHSHPMPPPFLHYPFNQQSIFCSNYLAYLRSTPSNTSADLNSNTPPDRFMSRSHLVEVKETPLTLLNNSKWDNLSQQIWSKFMHAQQTEETFKLKMRLWRYLYVTIKQTYPRYGLYLVGSTMSGFGADSSDVDMCLVSRSFAFVEQRMEALFNLTILRECLRKTEDFESFNLIEAKVPILRFRDKSNHFEVDLNFNNSVGIKNTHLLYCYTQLDWRLRPLALIVKLWAQYHDINNAKTMTISSYSLVLMVIHFLQCGVSPPVLPCLHKMFPEKFTPLRSNDFGHVDMNDNVGPYESKNTQPLGELFLNFLEYYSSFEQNAISVRTGGLLPVNVCRQAKSLKNDIHQWKELCIEEPFDLTNTARSVYDFETFERVKAVFCTSFHVLQKTLELNAIFAPLVLPRLPIRSRIYMKRMPMPNSTLISKVSDYDELLQKNEKPVDYFNEEKSNAEISNYRDDAARIEEEAAGRGDATPATTTAL